MNAPYSTTASTPASKDQAAKVGANGILAPVGIAASLGAVAASSCCVLPLALAGLGAGTGAFAILGALAPYRTALLAVGGLAVAGAWIAYARGGEPVCELGVACAGRRRSGRTASLLTAATILLAAAAAWNPIEPILLGIIQGS